MEKLIDLQLFAEDGLDGAGGQGDQHDQGQDKGGADGSKDKGKDGGDKKYSDADLDAIISKKFAKWQAQQQKAVDEAKKLAEMDAQQRAEYERDQLKDELAKLKKSATRAEMTKTARKMLSDDGINVPDELLSVMVSDDAETTKAAVDGFKTAFAAAVEAAVKDRLKGNPPKRGAEDGGTMTKEQIMAIRDPELRQKKMLENKHLFNF